MYGHKRSTYIHARFLKVEFKFFTFCTLGYFITAPAHGIEEDAGI